MCAAQYLGSRRAELRTGVKAAGKRLWMSEFGCGSSPPNGMKAGLELSTIVLKVPTRFLHPERCHCARICDSEGLLTRRVAAEAATH